MKKVKSYFLKLAPTMSIVTIILLFANSAAHSQDMAALLSDQSAVNGYVTDSRTGC